MQPLTFSLVWKFSKREKVRRSNRIRIRSLVPWLHEKTIFRVSPNVKSTRTEISLVCWLSDISIPALAGSRISHASIAYLVKLFLRSTLSANLLRCVEDLKRWSSNNRMQGMLSWSWVGYWRAQYARDSAVMVQRKCCKDTWNSLTSKSWEW